MVIACVCAVVGGLIAALPLLVVRHLALKPGTAAFKSPIPFGVVSMVVSLVVCIAMMLLYRQFTTDNFLVFGAVLVVVFAITVSIVVIRGMRRQR